MATIVEIKKKLDAVKIALSKTTSSYPQMVRKYGSDPLKWPSGTQWYIAESNLAAATNDLDHLSDTVLDADFQVKVI